MVKVLVIEDEMEIRANLIELLALEGYDIISADNGITGLIGAMEHQPDLILCDVMMPELDGHDVLSALRQEPETASIPFIFLTALADKSDIRHGMALGADDYLTKPFTCMEVLGAVESRLQKQAALSEQYKSETDQEVIALQQEIQAFRSALDSDQAMLISDMRSQVKDTLSKLNDVSNILKALPAGKEREQSIALIQKVCAAEIKMLARIPNFEYLSADSDSSQANGQIDELVLTQEADELASSFM